MDGRCHIGVSETNQLEIAGDRKNHCVGWRARYRGEVLQYSAVDTRGVVKDGKIERGAGTSGKAGRPQLPWLQKSDGVDLAAWKRPGNAVTRVDPNLIRQEGQRLMSHVAILRAHL